MIDKILNEIHKQKTIFKLDAHYIKFSYEFFKDFCLDKVAVHGRFQPPLHVNHFYTYIANGFCIAQKVLILITNPFVNEQSVTEAKHRSKVENNPFTYEQRVEIFKGFFENIGISSERYEFKAFDIVDFANWKNVLDKDMYHLINTYGDWSCKKLEMFQSLGYKVIHSDFDKNQDISGTKIREIINSSVNSERKKLLLIKNAYMEEAIEPLFDVLENLPNS